MKVGPALAHSARLVQYLVPSRHSIKFFLSGLLTQGQGVRVLAQFSFFET